MKTLKKIFNIIAKFVITSLIVIILISVSFYMGILHTVDTVDAVDAVESVKGNVEYQKQPIIVVIPELTFWEKAQPWKSVEDFRNIIVMKGSKEMIDGIIVPPSTEPEVIKDEVIKDDEIKDEVTEAVTNIQQMWKDLSTS